MHEVQHPQAAITVQTHNAKSLLGQTEYSTCSVSGDLGVLGEASEDDEWMDTMLQTVISSALMAGIAIAAGTLEWALKLPPPSAIYIIPATAALAFLAVMAVSLPSIFASYMVNKGAWDRNDAGRFLLEIGYAWFVPGFGTTLTIALGQAAASAGFLSAVAKAIAQLSRLAKVLERVVFAAFTIMLIGVAILLMAGLWFSGFFGG